MINHTWDNSIKSLKYFCHKIVGREGLVVQNIVWYGKLQGSFIFMVSYLRSWSVKFQQWEKSYPEFMFMLKNAGKTRFMLAMSKKVQVLGMEKLFLQEPRNFCMFFILFLLRDTILYILIPILVVYWIDL